MHTKAKLARLMMVLIGSAVSGRFALASQAGLSAAPDSSLPVLARTIPLPGVAGPLERSGITGRLDHLAYDDATHRLFLAAVAQGSLLVIDLDKGALIKSIGGLPHAQGVAVAPALGRVYVASGGDGMIRSYDTRTLEQRGSVFAVEDADNMRFDARGGRVWVGGGSSTAGAVISFDPAALVKVAKISIPSHAESFQLDPTSSRMFVNIPGAKTADNDGTVVVLDREKGTTLATWTLAGAARNFPMALDAAHGRMFVVSRKPPRLAALDASTGAVLAAAPCVADCDDAYFDVKTNRVFVIGGGRRVEDGIGEPVDRDQPGSLEVFAVGDGNSLSRIASLPLPPHARTGLFIPARRAIYIAMPVQDGKAAELREYRIIE
jgi:DNA-binding beta-propeller fold protein YncE